MKKTLISVCCFVFVVAMANQVLATPFQNGDFESGNFTAWSGDLEPTGAVNPNSDSHFTIITNSGNHVVQVKNDDTDWIATLYQDFTMDSLNDPGWTMNITFWIKWTPTDSIQDSIAAQLQDTGYNYTVDLLDGVSDSDLLAGTLVTQDITSFAQTWGDQEVELAFTISDGDYSSTPDSFQLDNISFNKHAPAPVPEPATILLVGSGLAGLVITKRKKRS